MTRGHFPNPRFLPPSPASLVRRAGNFPYRTTLEGADDVSLLLINFSSRCEDPCLSRPALHSSGVYKSPRPLPLSFFVIVNVPERGGTLARPIWHRGSYSTHTVEPPTCFDDLSIRSRDQLLLPPPFLFDRFDVPLIAFSERGVHLAATVFHPPACPVSTFLPGTPCFGRTSPSPPPLTCKLYAQPPQSLPLTNFCPLKPAS